MNRNEALRIAGLEQDKIQAAVEQMVEEQAFEAFRSCARGLNEKDRAVLRMAFAEEFCLDESVFL